MRNCLRFPNFAAPGYVRVKTPIRGWCIGPRFAKVVVEFGVISPPLNTMPAIKKSKSKPTKAPAPATKSARPPAKKNVAAPAAAPISTKPVELAVAALSVAAPKAVKPVSTKTVATTIRACIDVGFGNTLFARGEGPGLSWDKGVLMDCLGQDQWQLALSESNRPFLVKFLVNDTTWSTGPDYTVPSGVSLTLAPQF